MNYGSVTAEEFEPEVRFARGGLVSKLRRVEDAAAFPGDVVQPASLARYRDVRLLLSLVGKFAEYGLDSPSGAVLRLSPCVAEAGRRFLSSLTKDKQLPRIAPDEDGNLVMVWTQVVGALIVVMDGRELNAISAAATPDADYLPPVAYEGDAIPAEVFDRIPS